MWKPSPLQLERITAYCGQRGITYDSEVLGGGKDGGVWQTSRLTAVKAHDRVESYRAERNAYIRFRDVDLARVAGFNVPDLTEHDDDLLVIEMTIVRPPFVVDFASVVLDVDPELIEDEGHTLADMVRERFGDAGVDDVLGIRDELIVRAGAYLSDLHGHNIKFAPAG
jgi:hypothetical protein